MVERRKSANRIEKENRKKESEGNKNAENTERRWKLRGYEAGKVRRSGLRPLEERFALGWRL